MPSRRTLLKAAGISVIPLAGCTSDENQRLPPVYFSEVYANPEGSDEENLNKEYVLIELNTDTQRDLSDFVLEYGDRERFQFPDLVGEVASGASITIRSGEGEDQVKDSNYPEYTLFVGSDTPLLNNDGMELVLLDGSSVTADSVSYSSMDEGGIWARPE